MDDHPNPIDFSLRLSRRATNFLYRYDSLRVNDQRYVAQLMEEAEELLLDGQMMMCTVAAAAALPLSPGAKQALVTMCQPLCLELQHVYCLVQLIQMEVDNLLYFSERPIPQDRFTPLRNRSIDNFTDETADEFFGFSLASLRALHHHWRIPPYFYNDSGNGIRLAGEECFLVFLCFIRKGEPYLELGRLRFGGDPRRFSAAISSVSNHVYQVFYSKISGDSMRQWVPKTEEFKRAIWEKLVNGYTVEFEDGLPVREIRVNVPIETFRIFSFLDDIGIKTAAPGRAAQRENLFSHDIQRSFYSRYFRHHGLKTQTLLLPNGLFGSIYVASLRQNDNGVQNMSGLNDYLVSLFSPHYVADRLPASYADGIFARLPCIVPRYRHTQDIELRRINIRMSSLRQSIEHVYGLHHNLCRGVHQWERLRLYRDGERTTKLLFASFFYWNSYQCLNGSFNEFGLAPPSLEEYLPLDELLEPAPDLFQGLGPLYHYG